MAKTNENTAYKVNATRWDIGAVIFGSVMFIFALAFFFAQPTISLFGTTVAVTHAMIAMGVLMGAMIWALVEMVTRPRRNILDLIIRFFGSFILGFFIGGFMAFYTQWGQYILIPAYSGNYLALAVLIMTFVLFLVLLIDAVYLHNKTWVKHKADKSVKA